ncbi:MAG: protein-L-isoaspartate(D-aspartate) O-methyltransferase [Gammaproteobacteria bacterium]|nr:protein-L-isoaspartate(D-aspartate) O-methyltransferase [Gammaproteobacteria bacterium]
MDTKLEHMLETIRHEAQATAAYTGRSQFSTRVMKAMAKVPREQFIPNEYRLGAFDNGPLPIGHGQTISQPYIVALMSDLLELWGDEVVLEIGTGCGYQTAILSRLCKKVYSVERIPELASTARQHLDELAYSNVETRCSDGYQGWPEAAPFDAIIVTAAAPYIPPSLIEQLKPGGRMVIPLGKIYLGQQLSLLIKENDGSIHTESILGVVFVPLVEDSGVKDID